MKILLPVDGSVYSRSAIDFVATRASLLGKHPDIELLNVQTPPTFLQKLFSRETLDEHTAKEAENTFIPIRKIFKSEGMTAREKVKVGVPADTIAEEAAEFQPDLIIMGSRGLSAYQGLFMGSVTTGVLAQTTTPMLILRGKETPAKEDLTAGIAIDGSTYGVAAARYVAENPDLFGPGAEFQVINVVSDMRDAKYSVIAAVDGKQLSDDDFERLEKEDFEAAMNQVRPIFKENGLKVKEVMLTGDPRDEISDYVEDKHLDLLVMGSHGYTNFKSAVMGSVATHVAAEGNVPLLIIREGSDAPQGV